MDGGVGEVAEEGAANVPTAAALVLGFVPDAVAAMAFAAAVAVAAEPVAAPLEAVSAAMKVRRARGRRRSWRREKKGRD